MKIQCYMPVFNEADILPHTLRHLYEQGCAVHVIDGWSTDGSWEIALDAAIKDSAVNAIAERQRMGPFPRVTVERFPAGGPDKIQNCTAILERIEHLAEASDADWILYSDADEWRRAPGTDRLIDGVSAVDAIGFSAIDFRVFQFYCTTADLCEGKDWSHTGYSPEAFFRYYDEADCISRIPNRKLWKNVGRVHLGGGGHEVTFPGMRIYPQRFTMKHFPFRTPAQAKAKIETRLARRRKEEHDKGWGVHYDQYPPGFEFCWHPAMLKFWKDTRSPLP